MKQIFLVCSLLLFYYSSKAINTYVTFNPLNCINCSSGLYALCNENVIPHIKLVLKEQYKEDINDINEKYSLDKFDKLSIIYSDSMFEMLSNQELDGELIITNNVGKELLRQNLKQIDLPGVRSYYIDDNAVQADSYCFAASNKKLGAFRVQGGFITMMDMYSRFTIASLDDTEEKLIKWNDSLKPKLYQALYKDSFRIKYPVINEIITETPTYKPTISDVRVWDNSTAMVLFSVKDYTKEEDSKISLSTATVITKYSFKTNAYLDNYFFDNSIPSTFFLWDFFIENGRYFAQGLYYPNGIDKNEEYCLLELKCNEKTHSFSLKAMTPVKQPVNYRERKVSGLEEYNTVVKNNLLAFVYDNKITRLDNMKRVQIPFADFDNKPWNAYQVKDLYEDAGNYYVLYLTNNEHHILRFSKTGKDKKDIFVNNTSDIDGRHMRFYNSGDRVIYKPLDKDCLLIKNIAY